jgi:plasmid stabilization system protein ParE
MTYEVVLTDRAYEQLEAAYKWWADHRSQAQAAKWYNSFADAIASLANRPTRCPLSRENGPFPYEMRDLYFGTGGRRTHRAVFRVHGKKVVVLAIRHLAQQDLTPDDL